HAIGPWTIRDGAGGGERVSAATATGAVTEGDIPLAEAEMTARGQSPLFQLRAEDSALDGLLAARGYEIVDPTVLLSCPTATLTQERPPRASGFLVWEPLQIMREIWAEGGIGPERLAVMERAAHPKVGILGRAQDKPAAAAFVAVHDGVAMLHALEVQPELRRLGVARDLVTHAAIWAQGQGAQIFALAVTQANAAALGLYASRGMTPSGTYHYRIKPEPIR
ncbi:hypothetical protein LCGC14_2461980, partial [marine sediment metagenome]